MDLLQSPAWTFIGVLATIIVGFIGIYITLWTRNRKAIAYEIVSDTPIVAVRRNSGIRRDDGDIAEGIEISYKGQSVNEVRVVAVRIWNSGNVPITASDYVEPISLSFSGQLLGYDALKSQPDELRKDIIVGAGSGPDQSGIQLKTVLLNQKDSVTIQAVLTNFSGNIQVRARIVGVSTVRRVGRNQYSRTEVIWSAAALLAGILTSIVSFVLAGSVREVAALIGGILLGTGAVYLRPNFKSWRAAHLW